MADKEKSKIRQEAEKKYSSRKKKPAQPQSANDQQKTLQELQIHQLELEMQGEEITKEKEAIRSEKDLLDNIINTAPVIILTLDTKGNILNFNPFMEQLSGYRLEEVKGKDWFANFLPERNCKKTRELFLKAISNIQTKDNVDIIVTKDGRELMIEWNDKTLKDNDGKVIGLLSIGQDVTHRLQAEARLRESENQYKALFSSALDGLCLADAETGVIIDCNLALEKLVGRDRSELIGQPQAILHPPTGNKTEVSSTFKQHLNEKEGEKIETQVITKTGKIREVEIKANVLWLQGKKRLQGIFHDITDRKEAEQEIKRLALFPEMNPMPVVEVDKNNKLLYLNPAAAKAFPDLEKRQAEHPFLAGSTDYLGRFQAEGQQFFSREVKVDDHYYSQTISPTGQGNLRIYSFDITERKRAAEEEKKLATVVKNSRELINLATLDGNMIFLNDAGCQILGIDPAEVERYNIMQVIPSHLQALVKNELLPALLKGKVWQGNLQYINLKTGKLASVDAMTFTINDPDNNQPLYLANVSLDITERQKTNEEMKKKLEELEIFYKAAMDREDKILELKEKIEELEKRPQA
ncbi:MAG: PAS domain-containing protein [bacterium]